MFLEQIEKNRKAAFEHLVERKGQNKDTISIEDGYYSYKTKRGLLKTFVAFNSFNEYKKSDFYPEQPEQVNGFYFVALL